MLVKYKTINFSTLGSAELRRAVASMAKTANQRLREIEKQGFTEASKAYGYFESLAFDKDKATAVDSKGRNKWLTDTRKLTQGELVHVASKLQGFLNAKTSTITGIKASYAKGYKTFKERNPNYTGSAQEFAQSVKMGLMQKFKELYGSQEMVNLLVYTSNLGLTDVEIEKGLYNTGIYKATKSNKPEVITIYSELADIANNKVTKEEEDEINKEFTEPSTEEEFFNMQWW